MAERNLAARVSRLENLNNITTLSSRYALAIDTRDYAALRDMFTADATFGGTSDGAPAITGVDRIINALRQRLDEGGATYHCVYDVALTLDPENLDAARGVVTTHVEARMGSEIVNRAVRYADTYQRVGGNWRFSSRRLSFPMT